MEKSYTASFKDPAWLSRTLRPVPRQVCSWVKMKDSPLLAVAIVRFTEPKDRLEWWEARPLLLSGRQELEDC